MSHHTLLHRSIAPAIGLLASGPLSPDSLTGLRLATGLAAASCFAHGPASGGSVMAAGAALFLLSMLLDRADGALARRTGRFSRFGRRLDLAADCICTMACFVGLGIGAVPEGVPAPAGLGFGVAAAVSVVVLFAQMNNASGRDPGDEARVRRWFDPDDAMLVLPPAVWCGAADWILMAGGVLAPAAAIGLAIQRRRVASRA